jgi:DNA modification methylase
LKSAESGAGVNRQREGDVKIGCSTVGRTVAHPEAIDSTKEYGSIDTVITSPPYEGSLEGTTRHTRGGIASRDPALAQTGSYATVMSFGVPVGYSPSNDNIGNLKSSDEEYEALANGLMKNGRPTYLSEMLKVYGEMFKVLKPGGLAIIVVKPFVRNKKVVDLPYHTWILMAKVGFRLARLYKLRLFRLSFWRILQYKKHPDVPIIAHEYALVCQKPGSEPSKPVEPKIDPLIFMAETAAKKQAAKIL